MGDQPGLLVEGEGMWWPWWAVVCALERGIDVVVDGIDGVVDRIDGIGV